MPKKQSEPSTNGSHKFVVATKTEVARFFGVKPDTVRIDWQLRRGMPGKDGHYDLSEIAQWRFARMLEQLQARTTPTDLEAAKLEEEVRWKRLRNDKMEGCLVPRDEVLQEVAILCQRISDRIQAIPEELEMEIPSEVRPEVLSQWKNKIERILKEMSEFDLGLPQETAPSA